MEKRLSTVPLTLSILLSLSAALEISVATAQQRTFLDGMELGRGVDRLSSRVLGGCVTRAKADMTPGGQKTKFAMERIESKEQLRRSLGVDAQASLTGFGSAKAEYLKRRELNRYSLYVLVSVSVRNAQQLMKLEGVALTQEAEGLLKARQSKRFRERCGDAFINGLLTGGEFYAVYEVTSRSQKDLEDLKVDVEASLGIFGGSLQLAKALEKLSSRSNITVEVFQEGDKAARIPSTAEEILDYAPRFPEAIADPAKAVPYQVLLLDYRTLNLPSDGEAPLTTELFESELEVLAGLDNQYSDSIQDLLYVLQNEEEFEAFSGEQKQQATLKVQDLRQAQIQIQRKAKACFERNEDLCLKPFDPPLSGADVSSIVPMRRQVGQTDLSLRELCDKAVIPPGKDAVIMSLGKKDEAAQLFYKSAKGTLAVLRMDRQEGFWRRPKAKTTTTETIAGQCFVFTDSDVKGGQEYCYMVKKSADREGKRAALICSKL